MKRQRPYDDECRAACLACLRANNNNLKRTARQCGVPINSLRFWRDGQGAAARRARAMAEGAYETLADALYNYWSLRLLNIADRKLHRLDALQACKAAGHCIDAWVLLKRHQQERPATAPDLNLDRLTDDEREEFQRLIHKAAGRTAGQRKERGVRLEAAGLKVTFALGELGLSMPVDERERIEVQATKRASR